MLKKITLSSIFILALVFGFLLSNGSNRAYAYKTDGACFWIDQGHIDCKYNTWVGGLIGGLQSLVDKAIYSPSERPLIGGALKSFDPAVWEKRIVELAVGSCTFSAADCDGYYFDPALSAAAGYAIFYAGNGSPDNHAKYLHFVSGNPLFGYLSNNTGKIDPIPPDNDTNWIGLGGLNNANQWGDKDKCGLLNTISCNIQDDGSYDIPMKAYDATSLLKTIEAIKSLEAIKQLCEQQAPLGFVLCPIYEGIVGSISGLIGGQNVSGPREGLLISFLTFSPLNSTKTGEPGGVDALQGIVSSIIALANSFYVIVFLILIFSSSLPLGLDNYTIKKTLPKFIAAVIMTQFAYVICGVIIDFFNLLGTIVPNIIFALPVGSDIVAGGGLSNLQKGLQSGIAVPLVGGFFLAFGWILIIIFALIALVAIVVGFMYMILRYLVLFILILLAPIAFASWVLPGTEKFFSTWWKNFIRLNAMFPLITGMLAVSILLSQTLLASKETNAAVKLIAMVVPIIALFLIPKTLKWTTAGMSAIAGGMMGAVSGKMGAGGKAVGKGAKMAADKGKGAAKGMANEQRNKAVSGLFGQGTKNSNRVAAILAGNAPSKKGLLKTGQQASAYKADKIKGNREGLQYKSQASNMDFDTYNEQLRNIVSTGRSDELNISGADRDMRVSAVQELASRGQWGDIRGLSASGFLDAATMAEGIQPYIGDAATKAPDIQKGGNVKAAYSELAATKIADLDQTSIETMTSFMSDPSTSAATRDYLNKQLFTVHAEAGLKGKLDRPSRDHLNAYAAAQGLQVQQLDAAGQPAYTVNPTTNARVPIMVGMEF